MIREQKNIREEYNLFLHYVKSTWSQLFENDWEQDPEIDNIVINMHNGTITVCVFLKQNHYYKYDFKTRELQKVEYSQKAIKTTYNVAEEVMLYMMLTDEIIKDLNLQDVDISISEYIDGIEEDEYLTKELQEIEGEYAYDLYCMLNDL